jgi:hypothetical protein
MTQALKSYTAPMVLAAMLCLPLSLVMLHRNSEQPDPSRGVFRLTFAIIFFASDLSKKQVFGRLGNKNVSSISASRICAAPCKLLSRL